MRTPEKTRKRHLTASQSGHTSDQKRPHILLLQLKRHKNSNTKPIIMQIVTSFIAVQNNHPTLPKRKDQDNLHNQTIPFQASNQPCQKRFTDKTCTNHATTTRTGNKTLLK